MTTEIKHALAMIFVFAGIGISKEIPPKEGTYYTYGQLGLAEPKANGNRIDLVFKPLDEQFYWCPGIKVQQTKVAVVLTFVRCKTSETCGVDAKASIGKRLIRKVSVNTSGMDVYVRNGPKKFKRIYKSPESKTNPDQQKHRKTSKSSTKNQGQDIGKAKSLGNPTGSQFRTPALIRPMHSHILKRHVTNYVLDASAD
jgi:hypothetical protein